MDGHLFIIAGCSGVGKGTLLKEFVKNNPNIEVSVSATTRSPRPGEREGVNYYYLTKDEFMKQAGEDKFLEWAEYSGNYYGTKKSVVEEALKRGRDLILEIETKGAKQIMEKMNQAVSIFIMPPSLETLENRLRGRGTESEEKIQLRLSQAAREIEAGKEFDYRVVNDDLDVALGELQDIYDKERQK